MTYARTLWLLLVCAALIRVGALVGMPDSLATDPDGYRAIAENIVEHGVFGHDRSPTAYRPPAYPLLLTPCVAVGAGTRLAIGALHVLLGLATVAMTFSLASRAGMGRGLAALAAGLVAADPILLMQSTLVMSETLAAALAVLVILLLDRCTRRPTSGKALLCGAALGMLAMCRPGLLAFAGMAVMALLWTGLFSRSHAKRSTKSENEKEGRGRSPGTWQVCVGLVVGLGVVVAPWIVRNQIAMGRPKVTTTHGGYTLLLGNNPFFYDYLQSTPWFGAWQADPFHAWWREILAAERLIEPDGPSERLVFRGPEAELQADALAYRYAFRTIRQQPGTFMWSCVVRAGRFWSPLPFRLSAGESQRHRLARYGVAAWYIVALMLALIGIGSVFFRRSHAARHVLLWSLLLAFSLTAVHTFYWSNLRMRAPLMPLVAIAAVAGITAFGRRETD